MRPERASSLEMLSLALTRRDIKKDFGLGCLLRVMVVFTALGLAAREFTGRKSPSKEAALSPTRLTLIK